MTKVQKALSLGTAYASVLLLAPGSVFASGETNILLNNVSGTSFTSLTSASIPRIVSFVIQLLLGVAGVIAFIFLLWGGLQWILSGGDKEGTEKARKRITAALIGLAIVFSAYALIYVINAVFGVNVLQFNIPTITGGGSGS